MGMMINSLSISFQLPSISIAFTILATLSFASSLPLIGVAPEDEMYYRRANIWCKDGSKSFSSQRLNDDFCDCADGTDEPGTSACVEGKFYCRNVGHTSFVIFSSRVNDGICDCCDGSDEYDGKVECSDTCLEVGDGLGWRFNKEKAKLEEDATTVKQGIGVAKDMIQQEEEEELSTLREKNLNGLVHKLKDLKVMVLLEMLLIAVLLWWNVSYWKKRHATRRPKGLPH